MKHAPAITRVVNWRNQKISMSALMILRIVDRLNKRTGTAYVGEVEATYQISSREDSLISYTYNGIASMLRNLTKRGYLETSRIGRYNAYSLTPKALALFD